jgi:hypothetical protein
MVVSPYAIPRATFCLGLINQTHWSHKSRPVECLQIRQKADTPIRPRPPLAPEFQLLSPTLITAY